MEKPHNAACDDDMYVNNIIGHMQSVCVWGGGGGAVFYNHLILHSVLDQRATLTHVMRHDTFFAMVIHVLSCSLLGILLCSVVGRLTQT